MTPPPFRAAIVARSPTASPFTADRPAPPSVPGYEQRGPVSSPLSERPPPPSGPFSERPSVPPPPPPSFSDRSVPSSGPLSERSVPSSGPLSRRITQGHLWRITCQLEARHGAFFISRLILMTGIKLRSYDAASLDDPIITAKLARALRTLLSTDDYNEILPVLRDRG